MFKVFENTKIYVFCPPFAQTGGPEALHVLGYELRNCGMEAYMYYGGDYTNPVAHAYKKYNVPYVSTVEDIRENVMIVPEIWGHLFLKYSYIQKGFYWLSVDNYFGRQEVDYCDDNITHLVQSYYAMDFVQRKNVKNISYLSDYLNEFYTTNAPKSFTKREDIILYNPAKGMEFTTEIINRAPHLKFVPISGMSNEQIRELCLKSKIYIDFGNHPGKDRLPRETAVLGNIVITNKKGAAGFYDDVPIRSEYKFENVMSDIPLITDKLEYCLKNYKTCISDFKNYRQMILNEKEKFISDIKNTFIRQM